MKSSLMSSIGFRVVLIIVIIILLLIPLQLIKSLIAEREETRNAAIEEVSASWGGAQIISGPVLTIPIQRVYVDEKGKKKYNLQNWNVLPEVLEINGNVIPEIRNRSIYKVILYQGRLKISGSFKLNSEEIISDTDTEIIFRDAYLSLGISDLKGIRENIQLIWSGTRVNVNPGNVNKEVMNMGVASNVNVNQNDTVCSFSVELSLNGSRSLNFIPVGKTTSVNISSSWNNPGFAGQFLPDSRQISEKGFKASWQINHFNRNFPQQWIGNKYNIGESVFGVNFLMPVDEYQKIMRTTKYGLMIIILTFGCLFTIEIFKGRILHPVQYLLIGFALIIFYSLLLSLSEYISFSYSYIVSAAAVIFLISLYSKFAYSNLKLASSIFAILIALYGFMFVILQLQDYSLIVGTIGLFIVLAIIMYVTRKVNWFEILKQDDTQTPMLK
ncbi:MAG: cell envelope integrity protein CreD [bacterium]